MDTNQHESESGVAILEPHTSSATSKSRPGGVAVLGISVARFHKSLD
jgi:hypothetical protein